MINSLTYKGTIKLDEIKTKEYEKICPKCQGFGRIITKVEKCDNDHFVETDDCPVCEGKRIVDWIDKIKNGLKDENGRV